MSRHDDDDKDDDETSDESRDDSADEPREEKQAKKREEPSESVGARTLGVERWVQFGFIAAALLAFWLLDKIIAASWDALALRVDAIPEPNPTTVSLAAALVGAVGAFAAYRNEKSFGFAHDAATELSRVTWPSRKETWTNTIVVVVTSVIAAAILFGFDAAWSAVTDLIY
jgi:preprotein translocase subunit SecE